MNFRKIKIILLALWVVLWVVFLVREDKDGQYVMLRDLYGMKNADKPRYLMGADYYDFLVFCRERMAPGGTYEVMGLDPTLAFREVQAKYFLWPFIAGKGHTDYRIVWGDVSEKAIGYAIVEAYRDKGALFRKETF
jgi:hypothetical protein